MTTPRTRRGTWGEGVARGYLEKLGFAFVEANWRCLAGEIDLVMADGDELVFVEVKTRRGEAAGRAEEAIGRAKARRLLATGAWYVDGLEGQDDPIWRIDLVAITLNGAGQTARISHIENAVESG